MEPVAESSGIKVKKESIEETSSADTSKTLVVDETENLKTATIKTTAAIYVLEKTLYDFAEELENFFTTQDCEISVCDCWKKHVGNTIAETCANFRECCRSKISYAYKFEKTVVRIYNYEYLETLMTEAKGSGDEVLGLPHDVVIILGHSSVLLAEDKKFIETVGKINPTVIAFIGCSGGNARYGPIRTMSYLLPAHCKPILAFYQRRVYKTEVKDTSLMIGLQYYLHIKNNNWGSTSQNYMCAFGLAMIKSQSFTCTDPTVFIDEENFVHEICDKKVEVVLLPCIQLAMYKPMITMTNSEEFQSKEIDNELTEKTARKPESKKDLGTDTDEKPVMSYNSETSSRAGSTTSNIDQLQFMINNIEIVSSEVIISSENNLEVSDDDNQISTYPTEFISQRSSKGSDEEDSVISTTPIECSSRASSEVSDVDTQLITPLECTSRASSEVSSDEDDHESLSSDNQCKTEPKELITDVLHNECWEKIEELNLHKIIPLICEIKFIKLFENTVKLMKEGTRSSWENIDPLQFLVALLRGHWGKNTLNDIKAWATYHLAQAMKKAKNNPKLMVLHQYKLCCICFVLLCEGTFVKFVKKDQSQLDITVCTKVGDTLVAKDPELLPDPGGPFPDDGELANWVSLFDHCNYDPHCVELKNTPGHTWEIGNQYRITPQDRRDRYQYSHYELLLSLGALSDGARYFKKNDFDVRTFRQVCYNVSPFYNEDDKEKGHVKCFDDQSIVSILTQDNNLDGDILYIEMKLLLNAKKVYGKDYLLFQTYTNDPAMLHPVPNPLAQLQEIIQNAMRNSQLADNWQKVSSCRFVFAQFNTQLTAHNNKITGILFYTDTHYGHNLIEFNQAQLTKLRQVCTKLRNKTCYDKLPEALKTPYEVRHNTVSEGFLIRAINSLCRPCRYAMLDITIQDMEKSDNKIFPFVKVGRLTLTYNDKGELAKINLDECA